MAVAGRLGRELFRMAIHRFSKRQMTWFRGMERRGVSVHWVDGSLPLSEQASRVVSLFGCE